MKVRLAIVDDNEKYIKRLQDFYRTKFQDKIDIYYYSTKEEFWNDLSVNIDLVLISEKYKDVADKFNESFVTAFLVESPSIEYIGNIKAVFRYKKPELIYKVILDILAEQNKSNIIYKMGSKDAAITELFMPVSGGAGASCVALSYARNLASKGKKVIYINFEDIETIDLLLEGSSNGTFHDLLYAIKSKKSNIGLKIESIVCTDISGVNYFKPGQSIIDMLDIDMEDKLEIIRELKELGSYDYIIIDTNFNIKENIIVLSKFIYRYNFVFEETEMSIEKTKKLVSALNLIGKSKKADIEHKLNIICNKSKGKREDLSFINQYLPLIRENSVKKVIENLSLCHVLDRKAGR